MESMKRLCKKVNCSLLRYVALSLVLAGISAPYLQPWYHASKDAATILATVLSILAGFLIAVMAIVADERSLRGKNWRQDTYYLGEVKRQLLRHRLMFHLYLAVLVLIFLGSLGISWDPSVRWAVEWAVMFLGVFALLLSFRLPGELTTRQLTQLQQLLDARRHAANDGADDPPSDRP